MLILVMCPEDNFTLEPEGMDMPPVDPTPPHHSSGSKISNMWIESERITAKGVLCIFQI